MMSDQVKRVMTWLKARHHVIVPEDWVEACIDWLVLENQGSTLATDEVKNMVFEQWLLSDLKDIAVGCLPIQLVEEQKYLLRGNYCLQVNSILDVSTAYYTQLQKVKGTENENVHVSATQQSQAVREAKPGRLLKLQLTDGNMDVEGMEYHPIPDLHVNLTPGTKIQVHGEILCRLGVLMLDAKNVKVLGGEAETVLENTQEQLLLRSLGQNEELNQNPPSRQVAQFDAPPLNNEVNGNYARPRQPTSRDVPPSNMQPQQSRQVQARQDDDFMDDSALASMAMEPMECIDEQWDADMEDEAILTQINQLEQQTNEASHSPEVAPAVRPPQDPFDDDDEDLMLATNLSIMQVVTSSPESNTDNSSKCQNQLTSTRICPLESAPSLDTDTSITKLTPVTHTGASSSSLGITSTNCARNNSTSSPRSDTSRVDTDDRTNNANIHVRSPDNNISFMPPRVSPHLVRPISTIRPLSSSYSGAEDIHPETLKTSYLSFALEARTARLARQEIGLSSPPFTYIKKVLDLMPVKTSHVSKLKAYISTLVGKLEHNNGTEWSLMVKLNDGTGTVDVDLGDQMLTDLIGFTAPECLKLKQISKQDKEAKRKMLMGVRRCQQSLIQLSSILELEISPDRPRPYIRRHFKLTSDDVRNLLSRTMST